MSILRGCFWLEFRHPTRRRGDWSTQINNGVTGEGVNYVLDWGFRGGAQQPNWYLGLISDAGFAALDPADTHAAHAGWGEFTAVLAGNRPAWLPSAPTGGIITGPAPSVFQVTAAGLVRGAFLASRQPTGVGAGAVLYSTGAMSSGLSVAAGGTLSVTYTGLLRPR